MINGLELFKNIDIEEECSQHNIPSIMSLWLSTQPNYAICQEVCTIIRHNGIGNEIISLEPSEAQIKEAITEHLTQLPRLLVLEAYAVGVHNVYNRIRYSEFQSDINYRLIFQEPRYIEKMVQGYGYGNGATYEFCEDDEVDETDKKILEDIKKLYRKQSAEMETSRLALYQSRYGRGVDYVYHNNKAEPESKALKPTSAFVVYNNNSDLIPQYGIRYKKINLGDNKGYYEALIYTKDYVLKYKNNSLNLSESDFVFENIAEHYINEIPLTEVWNNEDLQGDFEPVISLIDAKNEIGSDNINAIRQFVENIMVFYGLPLGNDTKEQDKQWAKLKKKRWIQLRNALTGDKIENLSQQIDHLGMKTSKDSLTQDIAKYSMVPDFTSEKFNQIQSGIALGFSLISLESLLDTKNCYLRKCLQARLQKFYNGLITKEKYDTNNEFDVRNVEITFTTKRPSVNQEVAMIIPSALQVGVKKEVLAKQFDFVHSDDDIEEIEEEELEMPPPIPDGVEDTYNEDTEDVEVVNEE